MTESNRLGICWVILATACICNSSIAQPTQTTWRALPPIAISRGPTMTGHIDSRTHAAVVDTSGRVMTTSTDTPDGWGGWQQPGLDPAFRASTDTDPFLLSANNQLILLVRGSDDNLHVITKSGPDPWASNWRQLTQGGRVKGRISAVVTVNGSAAIHVIHASAAGTVEYRRFTANWTPSGTIRQWCGTNDAVLASDGAVQVCAVIRFGAEVRFETSQFPWTGAWTGQSTHRASGSLGRFLDLSEAEFFGGAYHVIYARKQLTSPFGRQYGHQVVHARMRPGQRNDHFTRVLFDYTPNLGEHPKTQLANFRNKLAAIIAEPQGNLSMSYWDNADPDGPWIGRVQLDSSARTRRRPAVTPFNGRGRLRSCGDFMASNFGDDLLAAVNPINGTGPRMINATRAFFKERLKRIGLAIRWCTEYTGTFGSCVDPTKSWFSDDGIPCTVPSLPAIEDAPVFAEVGYGTMCIPDWLASQVFHRAMTADGQPGALYSTWVHTREITPYIGPNLNVDYMANYLVWWDEMGHRLAGSLGLCDAPCSSPAPNLLVDLIPKSATDAAWTLFGRDVDIDCLDNGTDDGCPDSRKIGFTGSGNNYDVSTRQHSWIYPLKSIFFGGDGLRAAIRADRARGSTLLQEKYDWMVQHIYRGLEFRNSNQPLSIWNDDCPDATVITDGSHRGSTEGATADGADKRGLARNTPDVWFAYTATCDGDLTLETCGSSFDTVLSVHSGCPGTALNEVAAANDCPPGFPCAGGLQACLTVPILAGNTYYIRVAGPSGSRNDFNLNVSSCAAPEPTAPAPDRFDVNMQTGTRNDTHADAAIIPTPLVSSLTGPTLKIDGLNHDRLDDIDFFTVQLPDGEDECCPETGPDTIQGRLQIFISDADYLRPFEFVVYAPDGRPWRRQSGLDLELQCPHSMFPDGKVTFSVQDEGCFNRYELALGYNRCDTRIYPNWFLEFDPPLHRVLVPAQPRFLNLIFPIDPSVRGNYLTDSLEAGFPLQWHAFTWMRSGPYALDILFPDGGDLRIDLINDAGEVVATASPIGSRQADSVSFVGADQRLAHDNLPSGDYFLRVSGDSFGTRFILSAPPDPEEIEPPVIISHPADSMVCGDEAARFSVSAAGDGPFDYEWFKDGHSIPGAVDAHLLIPSPSPADTGTYHVEVRNAAGVVISGSARLESNCPWIDSVSTFELVEGDLISISGANFGNDPDALSVSALTRDGSHPVRVVQVTDRRIDAMLGPLPHLSDNPARFIVERGVAFNQTIQNGGDSAVTVAGWRAQGAPFAASSEPVTLRDRDPIAGGAKHIGALEDGRLNVRFPNRWNVDSRVNVWLRIRPELEPDEDRGTPVDLVLRSVPIAADPAGAAGAATERLVELINAAFGPVSEYRVGLDQAGDMAEISVFLNDASIAGGHFVIASRPASIPTAPGTVDVRLGLNEDVIVPPTASQRDAETVLRASIPDLAITYDRTTGAARTVSNRLGYLSAPSAADPVDAAREFILSNLALFGLDDSDLEAMRIADQVYSEASGATHLHWRQVHAGIPVDGARLQANVNRRGRIISVHNTFTPRIGDAVEAVEPAISPETAVWQAASQLGIRLERPPAIVVPPGGADQQTVLDPSSVSLKPIEAGLMWLPINRDDVRLAWHFQIHTLDTLHVYDNCVDTETGELLTRFDLVKHDSYRVYPAPIESPLHTMPAPPMDGRSTVNNPADATASPHGWHDTNGIAGAEFQFLSGNNVDAYHDIDADNRPPVTRANCGPTITCNFPVTLNQHPTNYTAAAVANLYYWNNLVHDVQYHYGFDEVAGNFQMNNHQNGGKGGDPVLAEAQDSAGWNNANFFTPPDGESPRMQMFLYTNSVPFRDGSLDNGIVVHEYAHGICDRLVGGPGNTRCLVNRQQPDEGLCDWWSLVFTHEPGDAGADARGAGTYANGEPPTGRGTRPQRYSTDPAVNTWTYASINGMAVPHDVGAVWAQAAWEAYWALVDYWGFDPDLQNARGGSGNQRMLLYVTEGLKNTICNPTFTDVRDGIIQAAIDNYGGRDVCLLWNAFADFGLGTDAWSPGPNSTNPMNGFRTPTFRPDRFDDQTPSGEPRNDSFLTAHSIPGVVTESLLIMTRRIGGLNHDRLGDVDFFTATIEDVDRECCPDPSGPDTVQGRFRIAIVTDRPDPFEITIYRPDGSIHTRATGLSLDLDCPRDTFPRRRITFSVQGRGCPVEYALALGYNRCDTRLNTPWIEFDPPAFNWTFPSLSDRADLIFPLNPVIRETVWNGGSRPELPPEYLQIDRRHFGDLSFDILLTGRGLLQGRLFNEFGEEMAATSRTERSTNPDSDCVGCTVQRLESPDLPPGLYSIQVTGAEFGIPYRLENRGNANADVLAFGLRHTPLGMSRLEMDPATERLILSSDSGEHNGFEVHLGDADFHEITFGALPMPRRTITTVTAPISAESESPRRAVRQHEEVLLAVSALGNAAPPENPILWTLNFDDFAGRMRVIVDNESPRLGRIASIESRLDGVAVDRIAHPQAGGSHDALFSMPHGIWTLTPFQSHASGHRALIRLREPGLVQLADQAPVVADEIVIEGEADGPVNERMTTTRVVTNQLSGLAILDEALGFDRVRYQGAGYGVLTGAIDHVRLDNATAKPGNGIWLLGDQDDQVMVVGLDVAATGPQATEAMIRFHADAETASSAGLTGPHAGLRFGPERAFLDATFSAEPGSMLRMECYRSGNLIRRETVMGGDGIGELATDARLASIGEAVSDGSTESDGFTLRFESPTGVTTAMSAVVQADEIRFFPSESEAFNTSRRRFVEVRNIEAIEINHRQGNTVDEPRIHAISIVEGGVRLSFQTMTGGHYQIQHRASLSDDSPWTPVGELVGDGAISEIVVDPIGLRGFYRLSTWMPPRGTIAWSGNGDGVSWHDPSNWSSGVPPGPADDVVISGATGPILVGPDSVIVRSLHSFAPLQINGASLTVNGTLRVVSGLVLNGGRLGNATVPQGQRIIVTGGNGTLGHVTLDGDMTVQPDGELWIEEPFTLNGTITLEGGLFPWVATGINFPGTQTIDGSGEIQFGGIWPNNFVRPFGEGSRLTVGPDITVRSAGQPGTVGDPARELIVEGTVLSEVSGVEIGVVGSHVLNRGHATARDGGKITVSNVENLGRIEGIDGGGVTLLGAWSNPGEIDARNALITLGGTFSTESIGRFMRDGGSVHLTGTMDNTGSVLMLDEAFGSWHIDGGIILGGVVVGVAGTELIVTAANGTLNAVRLNIDTVILPDGELFADNGLQVDRTLTLHGGLFPWVATGLSLSGDARLDGGGTIRFGGDWPNCFLQPIGEDGHLTIGESLRIHSVGQPGTIGHPERPITLRGTVVSESEHVTLTIIGAPAVNFGEIRAGSGGGLVLSTVRNLGSVTARDATLALEGEWNNSLGEISAVNSTTTLGGVFTVDHLGNFHRTGGTVQLTGILDNTDAVLSLDASTGPWVIHGGTIRGGSVLGADGSGLIVTAANAVLDGVILAANTRIQPDGELHVINDLTLNAVITMEGGLFPWVPTGIFFPESQSLNGTGEITFSGIWPNHLIHATGENASLRIGPEMVIRTDTQPGVVGHPEAELIVEGRIVSGRPGLTLTLQGKAITNDGIIEARDGGRIVLTTGTLRGTGTFQETNGGIIEGKP